ncbi:hypothetical protein HAX54_023285 [Datura stramonium]|uniref:Uncharacterized protein n=1 Tax=Datura stramonium TaxID=4076 RepID=A0ABS8UXU6_DATST|nr:hypothetical protein [Datura stramonium]
MSDVSLRMSSDMINEWLMSYVSLWTNGDIIDKWLMSDMSLRMSSCVGVGTMLVAANRHSDGSLLYSDIDFIFFLLYYCRHC